MANDDDPLGALVEPRTLALLAGIATLVTCAVSVPIMVIPSLANSVKLVQLESLLALVLTFGVLWRSLRAEARTREVERQRSVPD